MIGWIILFSILGLIFLLLMIPVRFCFSYFEKPRLTIWIAFIPVRILPSSGSQQTNLRKEEPEEKKSEPKKSFFAELYQEEGLKGFLVFLKKLLAIVTRAVGRVGRHLIAEKCEAKLVVGGEDSAAIAEQYGGVCAIVFPVWAQLLALTHCRKHQLKIDPDFLSDGYQISCQIRLRLRVFWVVRAAVAALCSFLLLMFRQKMHTTKQGDTNKKKNKSLPSSSQ